MPNSYALVTILTLGLFLAVTLLLVYGFSTFRRRASFEAPEAMQPRQVNPVLEVFWTSCAAVLLLVVFAVVR